MFEIIMEPSTAVAAGDLEEFNADRWTGQLRDLAKDPAKLEIDLYVAMLKETTNLFKKMGSAMSLAFSGKPSP